MKNIFILFLLFGLSGYSQTYNPALSIPVSKPLGLSIAGPLDARSMYYDMANFIYRPYQSKAEVFTYLNLPKYRTGKFPIYIQTGGTLGSNGLFTGGILKEYWFRDGTNTGDLIEKSTHYVDSLIQDLRDSLRAKGDSIIQFKIYLSRKVDITDSTSFSSASVIELTPIRDTVLKKDTVVIGLKSASPHYVLAGPIVGTFGNAVPGYRLLSIEELQNSSITTLTGGSTVTWNISSVGREVKLTLTLDATLNITGLPSGVTNGTIEITQDGTGGRTITLPSGSLGSVSLNSSAGALTVLKFRYNGTNFFWNKLY